MWRSWWEILQPHWRSVDVWPFSRDVSDSTADWACLLQGGSNGLYLVVVSLGWWVVAASKVIEEKPTEWTQTSEAMVDVDWVLGQLLAQADRSSRTQKRASSAAPPLSSPGSKRARHD